MASSADDGFTVVDHSRVRKTHKRARSSIATVATAQTSGSGEPPPRKKDRKEIKKPTLKLWECVSKSRQNLNKHLGQREERTQHLCEIVDMIKALAPEETVKLHEAAFWFYQDLSSALGQHKTPFFEVFLEATRELHSKLKQEQHLVHKFATTLDEADLTLKEKAHLQVRAQADALATAKRGKSKTCLEVSKTGLGIVGQPNIPLDKVVFLDAETGRHIEDPTLLAKLPELGAVRDPNSIPEPAAGSGIEGFVKADQLEPNRYRVYDHGAIYWFKKAKDGCYHFVGAAMWQDVKKMDPEAWKHLDAMSNWALRDVKVAFKVEKNRAQNMGDEKEGEIYMTGWHHSMTKEDSVTHYTPQMMHGSYLEAYRQVTADTKIMADALMFFQNQIASKVASYTSENLRRLGVPMFGECTIDFQAHKPGLGSNLSLSRHDKRGRNYGNGMHTDHDIDGTKLEPNSAYTTGCWWFANQDGKAEDDMEKIGNAFDPAYLIFPVYKNALDLNSHSFLMALWRGGMDEHGTTPSTVDLDSGLTRWGCSCQTNWGIPARVKSQTEDRFDKQGNLKAKPTPKGPEEMIEKKQAAANRKSKKRGGRRWRWVLERAGKPVKVESVTGTLNFIVEPFLPHPSNTKYYVCVNSQREGDEILFTHEGGVDIGDVDAKASRLTIPVNAPFPPRADVKSQLLASVPAEKQDVLYDFLSRLYSVYVDLHFAYLEINPLICLDATPNSPATIHFLDMAVKLDQTADSICAPKWAIARDLTVYTEAGAAAPGGKIQLDRGPPMVWPAPFRRDLTKEEAYIQKLDGSTGASLKLTVLNPAGRVWTMVAGGGASVVYSDAIAAHGFAHELANYGEYFGAPTEGQTYEYAKTIIDLITRGTPHPEGKILIIGGGIANFTNVAATFKGIIRALKEYKAQLQAHSVKIFVRRGGPNYQEGLKAMRLLGESLGVPIKVYGPETHITEIVPLALGIAKRAPQTRANVVQSVAPTAPGSPKGTVQEEPSPGVGALRPDGGRTQPNDQIVHFDSEASASKRPAYRPFDASTRSFVYGLQPRAIQGMLDFDYSCGRETPSVAATIYPFGGHHIQKFYWGTKETLLPVYTSVKEAVEKHPDADVVVNFASSRSVFGSTKEILGFPQIKAIALIAEGVPERHAREILRAAQEKGVLIIGQGCSHYRSRDSRWYQAGMLPYRMMDNIIASKLYRAGSVGYVSKSGGMSNELNNILSLVTNGTDRYPGTSFIDHLLRYEADPECKMLVLMGEVGGVEEYRVIEAVKSGKITKPIVAWAIGTCAKMFATEVQFGHAG
ncbi:citrate synthase, partial [Ceratobasidium sp. 392]